MPRTRGRGARVGLALAGGGPGGAAYEIGALMALEEAIGPLDFTGLDTYVGVSAGGFVGACLANGLAPARLVRALAGTGVDAPPLTAEVLFTPAYREFARHGVRLPRLLGEVAWRVASGGNARAALRALARLAHALPLGLFDGAPLRRYLHALLTQPGRSDDFRELQGTLIVVATELGSARPIRFGGPGWDHVPVSLAVQASAALPGLYAPVRVEGRYCVDGVLLKTLHASVALDRGVRLLFCINPIVPVDTEAAVRAGLMPEGVVVRGGITSVLSQTFRTLVHSRLEVGMSQYATRYPGADVLLFEPRRDEFAMFVANIFAFAPRNALCELGYAATRRDLRRRRAALTLVLARHGLALRDAVLADDHRTVWAAAGTSPPHADGGTALHRSLLRLSEALADAERGSGD